MPPNLEESMAVMRFPAVIRTETVPRIPYTMTNYRALQYCEILRTPCPGNTYLHYHRAAD